MAKSVLPPEILRRPKAGFTIPISRWLATDLRDRAMDYLSPSRVKAQGFFNPKSVTAMLEAHWRGKRDFGRSIWTLPMFGRWHDQHVRNARG